MANTTFHNQKEFGADFLEQICEWIADNMDPEDVFPAGRLEEWARDNDFEPVGE